MQKRFIELVTAFLDEAGIQCPIIPGEHIVTVPLGDFAINLAMQNMIRVLSSYWHGICNLSQQAHM